MFHLKNSTQTIGSRDPSLCICGFCNRKTAFRPGIFKNQD